MDGRQVQLQFCVLLTMEYPIMTFTTKVARTQTRWLVGWGLTALLTQNRSYRACRFVVGIFYSKL